jgi:hypothetical protein
VSIQCKDVAPVIGCLRAADGTVVGTVVVHYEYRAAINGNPVIHATRYTDASGTPVALSAGQTVTPGACAALEYLITGGGVTIAGPDKIATPVVPAFVGASDTWSTSAVPGVLQSVTVSAADVTDGHYGSSTNSILVVAPGLDFAMFNGEVRTWSVVRPQDRALVREYAVQATGRAYANITYTYAMVAP